MNVSNIDGMRRRGGPPRGGAGGKRAAVLIVALAPALAAGLYAPLAHAGCCRHGGWFAGGMIVGALISRPYYFYSSPPVYYGPPVLYTPPAEYVPPPVMAHTNPPVAAGLSGNPAAPAAALSIEERLRRLRATCAEGLLSAAECDGKRQELLQLM
jgi:hypothetical protein